MAAGLAALASIGQHCQSAKARNDLTQKLESLAGEISALVRDSGYVASGPSKARYQIVRNWIPGSRKHDRND
jgi:hypothetical protein